MEVDQALENPLPPPPPPPLPRQGGICFCCGKRYSARQLLRHRERFLEAANAQFAAAAAALNLEEEVPELVDDGMRMDNAEMEDGEGVAQDGAEVYEDPFAGFAPDAEDYVEENENAEGDAGSDAEEEVEGNIPPPAAPELVREILRNPPVNIEDWPDPGSDGELEDFEDFANEGQADDADGDPQYVERHVELDQMGDPLDEPAMPDAQLQHLLREDLGDLAEEELEELYGTICTPRDKETLQFLATRLRTHFSRQTYNELRYGPLERLGLPSEWIAWRRLKLLSGIPLKAYDCCVGSCVCFLGKYADNVSCPFCHEPRYTPAGNPRRVFHYTPLIPQLKALFRSSEMCEKLGYRVMAEQEHDPGVYHDVFDGRIYQNLRQTRVNPDHPYKFFDNPGDIALGLSTDGFTLFKRRKSGRSTAWPIIFINYNLHPRYRTRLENVICVGVIPGPRQFKDINSFLVPVMDELLELERGVTAYKAPPVGAPNDLPVRFKLHAFLLILFGDIPAVSKLLAIKGHNGKTPCRACIWKTPPQPQSTPEC